MSKALLRPRWEWILGDQESIAGVKSISLDAVYSDASFLKVFDDLVTSYQQTSCSNSYYEDLERFLNFLEGYRNCEVRSIPDLQAFLYDNMFLVPYLFQAFDAIWKAFGADQKVILEVIDNPGLEETKILTIYIVTELEPEEALRRLERIDEEWLLSRLNELSTKLCITVDYI